MIHNIPQPLLEEELSTLIMQDSNITLMKGWSIDAVSQVFTICSHLARFIYLLIATFFNAYLG